jgi:hypothetical protein
MLMCQPMNKFDLPSKYMHAFYRFNEPYKWTSARSWENFEDIKGAIWDLKSKKDKQYNNQQKIIVDKTLSWKIKIEQHEKKGLGELGFLRKVAPVVVLLNDTNTTWYRHHLWHHYK